MNEAKKVRKKSFYYTNEEMVKDLLIITPYKNKDTVLDAGSGTNKVWFNNLNCRKFECEIDNGCDFYKWDILVDWVIGNPPCRDNAENGKRINLIPSWIEKASKIAEKGFALLINWKSFNSLTPKRLNNLREKGFYLQQIHIVSDKRWFGRYYYLIFTKEKNSFISWKMKTY